MEGEAADVGEVARGAEGHAGVELGTSGHVAGARWEVKDVGVRIEEDAAGGAGE